MRKFLCYIVLFCMSMSAVFAETPTPEKLSSVFKEMIENTLPEGDFQLTFDVLDYRVKEEHVANLGLSLDVKNPSFQIEYKLHVRHPKLGVLDSAFEGMDEKTVMLTDFNIRLENESELFKSIERDQFDNFLEGVKGSLVEQQPGTEVDAQIVREDSEGKIEACVITLKMAGDGKDFFPKELEIFFSLEGTTLSASAVQMDPMMLFNIFGDKEQDIMLVLEKLCERDDQTVAYVLSMMQVVQSYKQMISLKGDVFKDGGVLQLFSPKGAQ